MKVRHIKTGNIYQYVDSAINATNEVDGQKVVIYRNDRLTFVREQDEFWEKFEEVVE